MLNVAGRRVFMARAAVDMRKSYQTLADVVRLQMGMDPLTGDVFVFVGRDRMRVKVLVWDASGYWVCAKRLEGIRYAVPVGGGQAQTAHGVLPLTTAELQTLLQGIPAVATQRRHALLNARY
jgi:transposase